jgi:hypothetical protein
MLDENVTIAGVGNALLAELAELAAEAAPRRFAICLLDPERDDGVVLGWGLALEGQAVAYVPAEDCGRPCLICARSPAQLPRMLRCTGDVRLVWIDAE